MYIVSEFAITSYSEGFAKFGFYFLFVFSCKLSLFFFCGKVTGFRLDTKYDDYFISLLGKKYSKYSFNYKIIDKTSLEKIK